MTLRLISKRVEVKVKVVVRLDVVAVIVLLPIRQDIIETLTSYISQVQQLL